MTAIKVAANLASYENVLCRLEEADLGWRVRITSLTGEPLYTLETNEEAEAYIGELYEEEEE